jgi:hypothetical protein
MFGWYIKENTTIGNELKIPVPEKLNFENAIFKLSPSYGLISLSNKQVNTIAKIM